MCHCEESADAAGEAIPSRYAKEFPLMKHLVIEQYILTFGFYGCFRFHAARALFCHDFLFIRLYHPSLGFRTLNFKRSILLIY
jgi:hypothetical protein